jgi:uncharacterized coiled-coil protein SlyX
VADLESKIAAGDEQVAEDAQSALDAAVTEIEGDLAQQALKIVKLKKKIKKLRKDLNDIEPVINIDNSCNVTQSVKNNGCGGAFSQNCKTTQSVIMICPSLVVTL